MAFKVMFTELALRRLELYLQKAQNKKDLIDKMRNVLSRIGSDPKIGKVRKYGVMKDRGYFEYIVDDYKIIYRIDDQRSKILIVAIIYAPLRPLPSQSK